MTSKIMINYPLLTLFLLTPWCTVSAHNPASSNYTMSKDVLSNSGGNTHSSSYQLISTIGQLATTIGSSNSIMVYAGFHQPLSSNTLPTDSIKLVAAANPSPICTGKSFDITFQTTPESNSIDGIDFYLKFDPTKLQANAINSSGVLDDVLVEEIDNTEGYLNFAAGIWDNSTPRGAFELITANFTVLAAADATDLQVDLAKSAAAFEGQPISIWSQDETLMTQNCMDCKVNLQGRPAIPPAHPRWETDLSISVNNQAPYIIKTDGLGHCILPEPAGDYSICVKGPHTLANRIGPPLALGSDNWLDFGTLLEGDIDDNNQIDLLDRFYLKSSKDKCQGDTGYIANADLNEDTCVDRTDYDLFKANFNRPQGDENPAVCEWATLTTPPLSPTAYLESNIIPTRESGSATLQFTPLPTKLTAGTFFEVAIQVNANQAIDAAAAYLNFDPQQLQLNHLTAGRWFDSVLENNFDNERGEINFVAGTWDQQPPKGIFTLVTLQFTLLAQGGEQTLFFNMAVPRQTDVIANGQSVLSVHQ